MNKALLFFTLTIAMTLGAVVAAGDDKYEAQAFSTLKKDDIERWHYTTLEQALRAIPGLQIMGEKVTHHNLPVAFYIDGEEHRSADEHQSELKQLSDMIDISTVKSIHFFNVPTLFSTSPTLNLHIEGITDDGEIINTDMKVQKKP